MRGMWRENGHVERDASCIHHYTEIPTLALILRSKRLRFARMDTVNDLSEAKLEQGIDFGKLFFVSCWTLQSEESIPLWRLYTKAMRGVRLSLPRDMFVKRDYRVPDVIHPQGSKCAVPSPLTFEQAFGEDHLILTTFLKPDDLGGPVLYTDDAVSRYREAVNVKWRSKTDFEAKIRDIPLLPRLKSTAWQFEREFRFALCILPSLPLSVPELLDPAYAGQVGNHIGACLVSGRGVNFLYWDVDLDSEVLSTATVTLGPCCTEGDRILVQSLLDDYAVRATLRASSLAGTMRLPGH